MKLEIVTPEQLVFSGEVSLVTVPGTSGRFTILKNHAPIISSLTKGIITYRVKDVDSHLTIEDGFVEVSKNVISIAVEGVTYE
ncbi:MAG: ATP synthase F1 subunit epsilon [Paludibacteraceae bacterium]|nr:ATP synthase F1 subunit epsilon [Paludibacteraceae bacterium]